MSEENKYKADSSAGAAAPMKTTFNVYLVEPEGSSVPAGQEETDPNIRRLIDFANNMNSIYGMFDFEFIVSKYPGSLSKDGDGRYQVKKMQNAILQQYAHFSAMFVIMLCHQDQVSETELKELMQGLAKKQQKGIQLWFLPKDGVDKMITGLSQVVARTNARLPIPEEKQEDLAAISGALFQEGVKAGRENDLKKAEAALSRALMIQVKLTTSNREKYLGMLPASYNEMGTVLLRQNRFRNAIEMYDSAIQSLDELSKAPDAPNRSIEIAGAHNNKGILFMNQVDFAALEKEKSGEAAGEKKNMQLFESALKEFDAAMKIYEDLKKDDEWQTAEKQRTLLQVTADTNGNIGQMYGRCGQQAEASIAYERGIADLRTLLDGDPENREILIRLGAMGNSLGVIYNHDKKFQEAIEILRTAAEADQKLMAIDDSQKQLFEPRCAQVNFNLFNAYRFAGNAQDAQTAWNTAWEICERREADSELCRGLFGLMKTVRDDASGRQKEAAAKAAADAAEAKAQNRVQDAINGYRTAATLYHGLPGAEAQLESARNFYELGLIAWDVDRLDQAEVCFTNEVTLIRACANNDEKYMPDLAEALFHQGRFFDEAKDQPDNASLKEAMEISKKFKDSSEKAREIFEDLNDGAISFGFDGPDGEV
ncbi:MAG: hypothetical protein K5760_08310 [Clostridium sp.]|nr:hypothetical protein [Clostridium sp.]